MYFTEMIGKMMKTLKKIFVAIIVFFSFSIAETTFVRADDFIN